MPVFPPILPSADAFRLRRAHVPADMAPSALAFAARANADRLIACDIAISGGRIASITPAGTEPLGPHDAALDGAIVLPRFVDIHTHLDKGHIWPRRPNPDGTFPGALANASADREANWSREDVARRMDFALRCAFAHGTGAIRTHLDSGGKQTAISWPLFREMRASWAGRIALQAAAIFPIDMVLDDEAGFAALLNEVVATGGLLGGVTYLGRAPDAKLTASLDRLFQAAAAHGLDVDLHVDESADANARTLEAIAEAILRNRFAGRVTAGHCCSLALMDEADAVRVMEKCAAAGLGVVSLPLCNMYLQDRTAGRTPRWRGVTPVLELAAAGVPVFIASDNTRDPFYAYGDLDMLEVLREATRILHLDHGAKPWWGLLGPAPADHMRLAGEGRLTAGGPADLVITRARSLNELLSRPQSDRVVLVAGRAIDTGLPDYRELDDLLSADLRGSAG